MCLRGRSCCQDGQQCGLSLLRINAYLKSYNSKLIPQSELGELSVTALSWAPLCYNMNCVNSGETEALTRS